MGRLIWNIPIVTLLLKSLVFVDRVFNVILVTTNDGRMMIDKKLPYVDSTRV